MNNFHLNFVTKTLFLVFSIVFLSYFKLLAQEGIKEAFGKISMDELLESKSTIDTTARAAYLFDKGKSSFRYDEYNGFVIDFERTARIKIYHQEGLEDATVVVPLYKKNNRELELLKDLKAFTYYLEDGGLQKVALDKEDVFEEDYGKNWIFKKFTFPKAKVGAVLEFYYRVETPFLFNLHDWEFQHDIPVVNSEYEVGIIPFYEYVINQKGTLEINAEEPKTVGPNLRFNAAEYKRTRYRWSLSNVSAFYEEDYMTSREDYIAKIEFQLAKVTIPGRGTTTYLNTWEDLIKRLIGETSFGKYMKKLEVSAVDQLVNNNMDELAKAKAIQHYIKENYKWDGVRSIYPSIAIKDFEGERAGNCAAINLKMLAMLKEAGLEAYPVLLSTRDHGKVDFSYPFIDGFNYCIIIVEIADNYVFIDGTRKYIPTGMLPFACRNGEGLIVKKKEALVINLNQDNTLYRVVNQANLVVDPGSNEVNVVIKISAYDYAAIEYRKLYEENPDNFIFAISGIDNATDVGVNFVEELEKPFVISYKTKLPDKWAAMNYISPVFSGKIAENPFKLPVRTYPVDFNFRRLYEYRFSFVLPEGYELAEYPESENIKLADDQLYYNYKSVYNANVRQFQLSNKFLIASPVISEDYYQDLKRVYAEVIEKLDEPIVVKKL